MKYLVLVLTMAFFSFSNAVQADVTAIKAGHIVMPDSGTIIDNKIILIDGKRITAILDAMPESGVDLETHLENLRSRYMLEAMDRSGGVQTKAAELLGMTFRSFRYFAKKYELTTGREPSQAAELEERAAERIVAGGKS